MQPKDYTYVKLEYTMEETKMTREDALQRFKTTRERKQKRLEEIKELLRTRYRNRTGEDPKYFFAL